MAPPWRESWSPAGHEGVFSQGISCVAILCECLSQNFGVLRETGSGQMETEMRLFKRLLLGHVGTRGSPNPDQSKGAIEHVAGRGRAGGKAAGRPRKRGVYIYIYMVCVIVCLRFYSPLRVLLQYTFRLFPSFSVFFLFLCYLFMEGLPDPLIITAALQSYVKGRRNVDRIGLIIN